MFTDAHQAALENAWRVYRTWAKTSRNASDRIRRSRLWVLGMTLAGAVSAAAGQQFGEHGSATRKTLDIIGALAIAWAAYLSRELLSEEQQKRWIHSRAMAEATKSEIFLFRAGIAPYEGGNAPHSLLARLEQMRSKTVPNLAHDPITQAEEQERLPTGPLDLNGYIEKRLVDQLSFYERALVRYQRAMRNIQRATLLLGALSVALTVLAAVGNVEAWIALIATCSASLAGYAASERYSFLIESYQSTAEKLKQLLAGWKISADHGDEAVSKFIQAVERTLSGENSAWLAKLSEKAPEPPVPSE